MEFFRIGVRHIMKAVVATVVLVPIVTLVLALADNGEAAASLVERLNSIIFPAFMLVLVYLARRHGNDALLAKDRRRVNQLMRGMVFSYATLIIVDIALSELEISIRLSNKIDIILPLFMGGIVLYALSLVQRDYQQEKERREKIERDLELAREIQDSLAPPADVEYSGRLAVRCFHEKHEAVAGDWLGMQTYGEERLIVVLADATGKGLQAALVIHALQSLWAEHRDSLVDYPQQWLERVNLTLRTLGEKRSHTLTIGLVLIEKSKVTYWSAGHLPLFLVVEDAKGGRKVTALPARGGVLGINPTLTLHPLTFDLADKSSVDIILASDGVLDKGSRTSSRELLALRQRIEERTLDLRKDCQAEDDKTLVHVKVSNAA
jgi:hypothetical protein